MYILRLSCRVVHLSSRWHLWLRFCYASRNALWHKPRIRPFGSRLLGYAPPYRGFYNWIHHCDKPVMISFGVVVVHFPRLCRLCNALFRKESRVLGSFLATQRSLAWYLPHVFLKCAVIFPYLFFFSLIVDLLSFLSTLIMSHATIISVVYFVAVVY